MKWENYLFALLVVLMSCSDTEPDRATNEMMDPMDPSEDVLFEEFYVHDESINKIAVNGTDQFALKDLLGISVHDKSTVFKLESKLHKL